MGTRHQDKVTGYIWADTTSEIPSTELEWKSNGMDEYVEIECLDKGKFMSTCQF